MSERIAKVALEYAQRQIKVGERFHVEPQHVTLLLTLGRIEPEEGEQGYVARDESAVYQTRDMTAQKRSYRRKGMTQ